MRFYDGYKFYWKEGNIYRCENILKKAIQCKGRLIVKNNKLLNSTPHNDKCIKVFVINFCLKNNFSFVV